LVTARERAYEAVGRVGLAGSHHRSDIAAKAASEAASEAGSAATAG
jgi:phosphoribosylamine---glycine ligase